MPVDSARVQAVFGVAIEITDPVARSHFVAEACGDDAELKLRVEELVRAHDQADSLLDAPLVAPADSDHATTKSFAPEPEPDFAATRTFDTEAATDTDVLAYLAPSTRPDSFGRIGHYEVLQILGRGGFGIVFRAFDEVLHRIVAIKVMLPQLAATSPARKRFLREARTSARVRHEHVVQIHAVEEQPIPHLVMEYIPGRTLQQQLDGTGPLETVDMLRIAVQVARGLAAAHAEGLIHRDIKPGNILLEDAVEPHVKITDFGLARTADDASLTQSGTIAGTPMYMAPEQAEGKNVDQRADLFSLGSVFYVMLSGRPPFRANSTVAVLKRVCEDAPRPIREIVPEVPEWMCDIVSKLHAKKPEDRFQTAAEVADLLNQHLAHLQHPQQVPMPAPVTAPVARPRARSRRAALVTALVGLLLLCAGGAIAYFATLPQQVAEADKPNPPEPNATQPSPQHSPPDVPPVVEATDKHFAALRREHIQPSLIALAGGGDPDQAPPELVAVLGDGRFVLPNGGERGWMVHSHNGKLLAVPCGNDVALFDAGTGALVRVLRGHNTRVFCVAFSPDDERLVAGEMYGDHTVRVWDVRTGAVGAVYRTHQTHVWCVAFHPDGKRIVSGDHRGEIHVWDPATGKELLSLTGHKGLVYRVAFSPDGTRIVSAGGPDKKVMIWDTSDGRLVKQLDDHTSNVGGLALSAGGDRLATGSAKELILWSADWRADEYKPVWKAQTPADWVTFDPDRKTVLSGKHDANDNSFLTVARWGVSSGEQVAPTMTLRESGEWVLTALSPDGKTIVATRCAPDAPYLRTYDARTGKELFAREGHDGTVEGVAVSPDGRFVASGGGDKTVRLWDLSAWKSGAALPPVRVLGSHGDTITSVTFSPDGKHLASGSRDQTVAVWDIARGEEVANLKGTSAALYRVAFSPDGRTLAVGGEDGAVRMFDVATRKEDPAPLRAHRGRVRCVAFSPDGRWLASGGEDRSVYVWDAAKGRRFGEPFSSRSPISNLSFSSNGKLLAALGTNSSPNNPDGLRVWSLDTRTEVIGPGLLPESAVGAGVAFSPASRLVAAGSWFDRLWFLDPANTRQVFALEGNFNRNLAFSPKGGYLAAGGVSSISIFRTPEPPAPIAPGSAPAVPDPDELAKRPSPADNLKRERIPADVLAKAGNGNPEDAPAELVAVLVRPQPAAPPNWIWYPDGDNPALDAPTEPRYFRTTFQVEKPESVRVALLRITADNEFTAWLNGVAVGSGADYGRAFLFDVKGSLVPGTNVLAVRANNTNAKPPNPAGLVAQFTISRPGEPDKVLATDASWRSSRTAGLGWKAATYDDKPWVAAKELGTVGGEFWKDVRWSGRPVQVVAISPDGKTLASVEDDHLVNLWDLENARLRTAWMPHEGGIRGFALSPDGKQCASIGADNALRFWDAVSGKPIRNFALSAGKRWGLVYSPDGKFLAWGSEDGLVRIWDAEKGKVVRVLHGHSGAVPRLIFSPDGKQLASVGRDERRVRLWDVATGWQLLALPQDATPSDLAFGPGGQFLATTTHQKREFWDLTKVQPPRTLTGSTASLAFRPDGRLLATGSYDGEIKLWEVGTDPNSERAIKLLKGGIYSMAFTPEGRYLATANQDGTVYVLRLGERGGVVDK